MKAVMLGWRSKVSSTFLAVRKCPIFLFDPKEGQYLQYLQGSPDIWQDKSQRKTILFEENTEVWHFLYIEFMHMKSRMPDTYEWENKGKGICQTWL